MVQSLRQNRFLLLIMITVLVYLFLKYITPIVAPALLALLFVSIFGPLLQRMENRLKIHRQVGVILFLILACGVIGMIGWILFSWLIGSLPDWLTRLDKLEQNCTLFVQEICSALEKTLKMESSYLEKISLMNLKEGIEWLQRKLVPNILSQSLVYIKAIMVFGGFLLCFIVATVLFAKDYDKIMNELLEREDCHLYLEIICGVIRYIATLIKSGLIIMLTISAVAALVLGLTGFHQGVLWGLLAGVLDAFPFIGTGVVLVPLAFVRVLNGEYIKAVICFGLYLLCIFIREWMEPRLIGKKMGVSPIIILLSIYAGIRLFGVWGILEGPLGFVIIRQTYTSLVKRFEI